MSDCERLSDRMPDVALQRSAWTGGEAAHLATCADCRAEWALLSAARDLGVRAPAVDTDTIAAGVLRRLASERTSTRRSQWFWVAGSAAAAAAAIAVAVGGGLEHVQETSPPVVAEAEPLVPLPELEGLESAQLDTLLQSLDGTLAGSSSAEPPAPSGSVDAELEQILATWEG